MASVISASAVSTEAFSTTSVLQEVWSTIGNDLAIFAATLVFALLFRTFSNNIGTTAKAAGKGGKMASFAAAPTSPKAQAATPKANAEVPARRAPRAAPDSAGTRRGACVRDAATLLDEVVISMRDQGSLRTAGRALQLYHEDLRAMLKTIEGRGLQEVARLSRNSPLDLFTTLLHCAVRSGRYHLVDPLIGDMIEQGIHRPLAFYESTMKQLAGQKQYHLALTVFDRLDADGLKPSAVTCSCLVGFAAEVGELQRAVDFFENLSAITTPSIRAYMTVLRVHAKRQDFEASVKTLRDMDKRGVALDSLALNVVLATGIAADKVDAVAELVDDATARSPRVADVVSYNTLIKGYALRSNMAGAVRALDQMKQSGISPNAITFNTAMDAAIRNGEVSQAWRLAADMRQVNLRPDKFTCSILVKGLAREATSKHISDALALLQEVGGACENTLRSTLYHAVLEAAARASGHGAGTNLVARVFSQMRVHHVVPSAAAQRLMVQALPTAANGSQKET